MSVTRRWIITTVENLTLSDKERDNDNGKKTDYWVSLSRYCTEFWKLDPVQQQNIIGVNNNNSDNNKKEEDDDDTTAPFIWYHDLTRACTF